MLATVLKGERARDITFAIIETFAKVRELKRELLELHTENGYRMTSGFVFTNRIDDKEI